MYMYAACQTQPTHSGLGWVHSLTLRYNLLSQLASYFVPKFRQVKHLGDGVISASVQNSFTTWQGWIINGAKQPVCLLNVL